MRRARGGERAAMARVAVVVEDDLLVELIQLRFLAGVFFAQAHASSSQELDGGPSPGVPRSVLFLLRDWRGALRPPPPPPKGKLGATPDPPPAGAFFALVAPIFLPLKNTAAAPARP